MTGKKEKCLSEEELGTKNYQPNNLLDATFVMFNDFKMQIEEAVKTYLPNVVPDVYQLIEYCKDNKINKESRLDPGYADLYAWYENVKGYDCLLSQDQNHDFLTLVKGAGQICVYEIKNMRRDEEMEPSLEDFANIVIPSLLEDDRKNEEFIKAIQEKRLEEFSWGKTEECPIRPIVTLSYHESVVDGVNETLKHALTTAGFDYISDIKILNSFETQIGQFIFLLKQGCE